MNIPKYLTYCKKLTVQRPRLVKYESLVGLVQVEREAVAVPMVIKPREVSTEHMLKLSTLGVTTGHSLKHCLSFSLSHFLVFSLFLSRSLTL